MTDDLRSRLHEELSGPDRAPVDVLVAEALQRGRRARRVRRAGAGVGTVAVVGLTVFAVTIGSQLAGGSPSTSQQAASPAVVHTITKVTPKKATAKVVKPNVGKPTVVKPKVLADTSAKSVSTDPPAGVPATTGGVLQLLSDQLGTLGTTSHVGATSDDPLHVQLYLTTAAGTGMVRVDLQQADFTPAICLGQVAHPSPLETCTTDAAGDYVVTFHNAYEHNCTETESVQVIHPDGSEITFYLATCLAWDGAQNASSPQIITDAQAAAFGADPRWDLSMPAALVAAGATNFPSPAPIS